MRSRTGRLRGRFDGVRGRFDGARVREGLGRVGVAARPYLIVLALSSFVVSRWFRTGTFIATGDMGPFIRRGWEPEFLWSWNHQTTGAGSAGYTLVRSFEFILIWACHAVGLGEYTAQWMFYTVIYGLVGFGVAYFAAAFVRNEPAIVVAGAFGVLNGFFLTRLPNPLNILSVGSVALITGIAVRVAQGRRIPTPAAGFALLPTSFLAFNPPMLVVAYAWAAGGAPLLVLLVQGRRPALRLLWWYVRAAPWVVLLNGWWLVPLAQSFGGGGATVNATFTDPSNWSWSQINNTPHNVLTMVANWAWFRPQYLPFAADLDRPGWIWIRYLLPALVFLGPVLALRGRRRVALGLLGLVVVFVALAKGLRPPLRGFNLFLYENVPGFWLFREPMSKLGQLLIMFFGVLLAVGVEGVLHRLRTSGLLAAMAGIARAWRAVLHVVALGPVLLVLAYPYPLYSGGVMPDERPTQPSTHVRVPQAWWSVAERIDADPRPGKVLVLPLDDYYQMPTTWGFFGVDSIANLLIRHPVVQRKPDGYFGDVPGFNADVQAVETALLAGDLEPVPRLLAALGVSEVIVRHDLVRGLPGRSFADDRILTASMERVPGLRRVEEGMLDLWEVGDGSSPTVRTYERVLDTPARPDAGAAVLGSVGTATAVAARVDTSPPPVSPRVDDTAAATGDVVHWPVPAVDSGVPTTTVTLPGGRYTVAQRARAAAVLTPRVDDLSGQLLLEDPTAVMVDGTAVSRRPALTVALPDRPVVAVRAGTRTVSLDGWGRGPATPGTPATPGSLPVAAATDLTLYSRAVEPAAVGGFTPVWDCNNYEPRPREQLGLAMEVSDAPEGKLVRLRAADHAACTTVVIGDAVPGRTYRIRLEYRNVSGSRPQICVLQTGLEGCELTAQPVVDDAWTSYERIVTVDEFAQGLQVVLHADVGERFQPETVNEYRGLRVEAIEAVHQEVVWPPAVPPVTVDLAPGEHELRVDGGLSGSVLAPFEPLQDCFRYDDQTADEAGLTAKVETGMDGVVTYTLGAVRHLACMAATAPEFGAASLYELSMEARSVAVRNPKFCVYARGPDRCHTLPPAAVWDGWNSYETLFGPDPAAVETRLYLYGLRDLEEKRQSRVEYRKVRLRPVASPVSVVLLREAPAGPTAAPDVRWSRQNPAHFDASVSAGGPVVLALAENAAPGWTAQGAPGAEKITLQGWMSGWRLPAGTGSQVALVYAPARISRFALYALPVAAVAAVGWIYLGRRRASRSPARPGRPERPERPGRAR